MTPLRAIGIAALSTAAAMAIAWGSGAPLSVESRGDAAIRLSWRAAGRPVEQCRTPSPEELARLPVHMRRSEICERSLGAFHLAVDLDGATVIDERVAPEGARHDRPAYVLRELRVAPGAHRLAVRFAPENSDAGPVLALDEPLELAAREVALVTEDPQRTGLAIRRSEQPGW